MKSPLGRCYVPVDTEAKWRQLMQACEDFNKKHDYNFCWENCKNNPTDEDNDDWGDNDNDSVIDFGDNFTCDNDENEMDYSDLCYWNRHKGFQKCSFEAAMKLLEGRKQKTGIVKAVQIDGEFYTKEDIEESLKDTESVVAKRKTLQKALKLLN